MNASRRHVHPEKKGALVGTTKTGKGTKLMVLADGAGTPLGVYVAPATPAEVKLLEPTLNNGRIGRRRATRRRPKCLTADLGYDSNKVGLCWPSETLSRSSRPAATTQSPPIKRDANCSSTDTDGSLSASLRGCKTSIASLCATNDPR